MGLRNRVRWVGGRLDGARICGNEVAKASLSQEMDCEAVPNWRGSEWKRSATTRYSAEHSKGLAALTGEVCLHLHIRGQFKLSSYFWEACRVWRWTAGARSSQLVALERRDPQVSKAGGDL